MLPGAARHGDPIIHRTTALAFILLAAGCLAVAVFPRQVCGAIPLLGDEGEGACLRVVGRHIGPSHYRVVSAIRSEIREGANDVVLSDAAAGLTEAGRCRDLSMIVAGLDATAPGYVRDIFVKAGNECERLSHRDVSGSK